MTTFNLILLMASFLGGRALTAQELISPQLDSLIKRGIRLSITQSYEEAIVLFESIEREKPESPVGYFFHAAVLQSRMMDYERYRMNKFEILIEKTIETARYRLKENDRDTWALFFLGGAYGYRAFQLGKQKKYLAAIHVGRRSIKALSKVVDTDSPFYDAHFGIGYYLYYRSKLTRHFSWLPFVDDERAKGIEMIRLALRRSNYSQYAAMNSLCWILIDEEKYEKGYALASRAIEAFPTSRVFLWCAAKLSIKLERWKQAAGFYSKIIASLQDDNALFAYNELICRKNLALAYSHIGQLEKADDECVRIETLEFSREEKRIHKTTIKGAIQACEQIMSQHTQGSDE